MIKENPQRLGELRKWASLWADLVHVEMTISGLREMPDTPPNVFVRRSLWEAAVIAYGRMTMSDRRRKVDFDGLLDAAGDREVHERVLDWRHGHVAHRRANEFEQAELIEHYDDAGDLLKLEIAVAPAIGPADDTLIERFESHVFQLRVTLWERYLGPLAHDYAISASRVRSQSNTQLPTFPEFYPHRFSINLTLWDR